MVTIKQYQRIFNLSSPTVLTIAQEYGSLVGKRWEISDAVVEERIKAEAQRVAGQRARQGSLKGLFQCSRGALQARIRRMRARQNPGV
jgi:hypothetical protein